LVANRKNKRKRHHQREEVRNDALELGGPARRGRDCDKQPARALVRTPAEEEEKEGEEKRKDGGKGTSRDGGS